MRCVFFLAGLIGHAITAEAFAPIAANVVFAQKGTNVVGSLPGSNFVGSRPAGVGEQSHPRHNIPLAMYGGGADEDTRPPSVQQGELQQGELPILEKLPNRERSNVKMEQKDPVTMREPAAIDMEEPLVTTHPGDRSSGRQRIVQGLSEISQLELTAIGIGVVVLSMLTGMSLSVAMRHIGITLGSGYYSAFFSSVGAYLYGSAVLESRVANAGARAKVSVQMSATQDAAEQQDNGETSFIGILRFVMSTFCMVVTNMLLTAIDKSFVGRNSSLQLAALGPSGSVYDCSSYLLTFLNTATLSLLAAAPESERNTVRSQALFFTIGSGALLSVLLLLTATPAVQLLGASAAMLPFAQSYLRMRAVGAPIDRLSSVCTQFCLAEKNGALPLLATVIASVFNVVGDFFLVPRYGVTGAAIATIIASAISGGYLVTNLRRQGQWPKQFKRPSFADFRAFTAFAGPVFLTLMLKIISFAVTTAGATMLGVASGAAHQILVSLFFIGGISLGQPLTWAAQSYLTNTRAGQPKRKRIVRALLGITCLGSIVGAGIAGAMARFCLTWFTSDPAVQIAAAQAAPGVLASLVLYIGLLSMEGFAIALKRVRFTVVVFGGYAFSNIFGTWWQYRRGILTLTSLWRLQSSILGVSLAAMVATVFAALRRDHKDAQLAAES